jgi:hypothetical protein
MSCNTMVLRSIKGSLFSHAKLHFNGMSYGCSVVLTLVTITSSQLEFQTLGVFVILYDFSALRLMFRDPTLHGTGACSGATLQPHSRLVVSGSHIVRTHGLCMLRNLWSPSNKNEEPEIACYKLNW